ncbi:MAG TPA: hypothetical protein VF092_00485 [Longimicrobium sp.]
MQPRPAPPRPAAPSGQTPAQASETQRRFDAGMAEARALAARHTASRLSARELQAELDAIRERHGFTELRLVRSGRTWVVHARLNPYAELPLPGAQQVDAGGQTYEVFATGGGAVLIARGTQKLGITAGEPERSRVAAVLRTFFGDAEARRFEARRPGSDLPAPSAAETTARRILTEAGLAAEAAPGAPPPPTPGQAERTVIIYRGTTWQVSGGVPGLKHDLGPGLYVSPSPRIGAIYAEERRVDERTAPGSPGVVLATELTERDLGRVLDIYNDGPAKRSWEDFLYNDRLVKTIGPALAERYAGGHEHYFSLFSLWLQKTGRSLGQYDAIIAPEYRLKGPQMVIRNRAIIDALLRRAQEAARAVDAAGAPPHPGSVR